MVKSTVPDEEFDQPDEQLPRLSAEGKLAEPARIAIERQKAMGLAITFLRDDLVITQYPDGREEIIGRFARRPDWTPTHTLAGNNG